MEADPAAFRSKFRTMARDPFAFYRGTACLFYADLADGGLTAGADERWVGVEGARRVWVQGDLHAENFGTYLAADGRLVFDVNDFDEAYLGHWTWDPMRFCASLALLCWQKALPDDAIDDLVGRYLRAYVAHVHHYVEADDDTDWALTLDTARGGVLDALRQAKLSTRVDLLDRATVVEDWSRRFAERPGVRRLSASERSQVESAFERYLETLPDAQTEPRGHLRRPRRRGSQRLRHRQRRAAGLQRPDRGLHPGARQRRRADAEAGQRRRPQPGGRGPRDRRLVRAPRPPDGGEPARSPGPRRPLPRVDRAARHRRLDDRVRRRRVLAVRGRPRLGTGRRALRHGRAGRAARAGHGEDPLRRRRGVRARPRRR